MSAAIRTHRRNPMPKKTKALAVRKVEVLRPAAKIPDARAAIEHLVEQKISEIMGSGDAIFEPFFRTKEISREIRRLETVPMQRKWTNYFEEWGCLICEKKGRSAQIARNVRDVLGENRTEACSSVRCA